MQKKEKIIIIGGGVSGLTAGIYAQKAGFDTEIYEKNAVLGGNCIGWHRRGFYIDNCISWLTCASPKFPIYEMWKECGVVADADGNEIPLVQPEAFYTSELDGQSVTLWCDLERAQREMIALSPEDEAETRAFFKGVKMCESLQVPYEAPLDMMNLFQLTRLGLKMLPVARAMGRYKKTSLGDLAKRFKHPLLKKMLTDYLPKDYLVSVLLCAYGTLSSGGGGVPEDGSSNTIKRMEEIYLSKGGRIFKKTPVRKILVGEAGSAGNGKSRSKTRARGILLEDNREIAADYIIPACDTNYVFENLLDKKYMPKKLAEAYENSAANPCGSSFQLAFEYDGTTEEIGRRTFFDCEPFLLASQRIERMNMKNYRRKGTAPDGKNLIQVKILQNENAYFYWEGLYQNDQAEYKRQKEMAAQKIQAALEARVPSAKGKLHLLDIWTPYTYTRYTNAYRGSYMGFIVTKESKNLFNINAAIDGLCNVFLAGQWLSAPGGLPMAMTSGKFAVQRILRSLKKSYKLLP